MEERLARLIWDYSKKYKKANKKFITECLEITKQELLLEDYILNFKITHNKHYLAAYHFITNDLDVNINTIYKDNDYVIKTEFPNICLSGLDKYILLTQVLLHEIEHAKQKKQTGENKNDLENLILSAEFKNLNDMELQLEENNVKFKDYKIFNKNMKLRKEYYNYSVSERLAETNSSKLAADIALILDSKIVSELMMYNYWNTFLRGYEIDLLSKLSDEPTKFFLSKINPNFEWEKVENLSKNLDDTTRVSLGLQVHKNELCNIADKAYQTGSNLKHL